MRLNTNKILIALAFSLAALPVWAAHMDSAEWVVDSAMTIGTTQVQPGQYQLKAEEGKSDLEVTAKDGKVIATIPVHWTDLPTKAQNTEVLVDGGKVTQVEFSGRTATIQFNR